jgi:RNA polymerase sigma-70 factor, ECF subfamily
MTVCDLTVGAIMAPSRPTRSAPTMTERLEARPDARPDSSFELLLDAKRGNTVALERLCARYLPRLRRWAHGRLPNASRGLLDTDDLAQEVLFRAVGRVETFEPRHEGAFQGYLRQMLLNRVRDEVRKIRRRPGAAPLEDEHAAADPSPLELAIGQEAVERYEQALQQLSAQERELVIARVELNFSSAEIAEAFDKPTAAAAHMAVSRALMRLAKEMSRA